MNTNNPNSLPPSFRNFREQNNSQEGSTESSRQSSPQSTQEDSSIISDSQNLPEEESIMYTIYCHGEMMSNILTDNFRIPKYLDRTIHLYYLVDIGYILLGHQNNILQICNANVDPRHSNESNDIVRNMILIGGKAIGVPLGVYVCNKNSDGIQEPIFIFDMTNNFPPPYQTTLKDTIDNIIIHHSQNFPDKGLRITMHTCRVIKNRPRTEKAPIQMRLTSMPRQNIKFFGEKELSNLLEKNIDISNSMDTSVNGGKSGKKKTKTVKNKTKKRKIT
jgi:hypothetical protein